MPRESRSRSSVVGFCTYHPESAYRSRMHGEVAVLAHPCLQYGWHALDQHAGIDLLLSDVRHLSQDTLTMLIAHTALNCRHNCIHLLTARA